MRTVIFCFCLTIILTSGFAFETTAPIRALYSVSPDTEYSRNSEGDLIELKDGSWAYVWSRFTGGDHDESSAHLVMSRTPDKGNSWTSGTVLLPNEGGRNVMSVSLRRSEYNGEILLFYLRKDTAATSCTMYVRRSSDELRTLSNPVRVTLLDGYHVVNNDRVIRTSRGRWVVPAMLHPVKYRTGSDKPEFGRSAAPMAYYSDDDGRSWKKDSSSVEPYPDKDLVLQENGIVELASGDLYMFMRTNQGCQYYSISTDQGHTWSRASCSPLKSPMSPASIERFPDSDYLLCVWNDHSGAHPYPRNKRTPLCHAISKDNGYTWLPSRIIEGDPAGWFCYTSITWIGDNCVLSYCSGDTKIGPLNRSSIVAIPVNELLK